MSMRSSQHIDLMNFLGKFGFTAILASPQITLNFTNMKNTEATEAKFSAI